MRSLVRGVASSSTLVREEIHHVAGLCLEPSGTSCSHSNSVNFLSTISLHAWNPNTQTRSQCRPIGIAATYQRTSSIAGLKV